MDNEKILIQALEMEENGKSVPEILALFPEAAEELKEMFAVSEILAQEKEKIMPPARTLDKVVTSAAMARYINQGETKGRPRQPINLIIFKIMKSFWRTVVPVGLVAVAFLAVVYYQHGQTLTGQNQSANTAVPLKVDVQKGKTDIQGVDLPAGPLTASDVDKVANDLVNDYASEGAVFDEEDANASLVTSDKEAASELGGIYNPNEF